ncbi:MAG TPA: PGPGW domain-containing protein [Candidatus Binataceae bacterium]|nr:PGPGW domain-containing protein [Candidatus Binataceae bacterium]
MHPIVFETVRQAKRAIIAVVGFTVVALGVVMIVTPGPGWLFIFLGLSVLAAEFVWARRLLKRLKEKGTQVREAIFGAGTAAARSAPKPPADEPRRAP